MKLLRTTPVCLFALGFMVLGSAAGQCGAREIRAVGSEPGDAKVSSPPAIPRIHVSPVLAKSTLCGGNHKVIAPYPAYAKAHHIQGTVVLHIIIDKEGQVSDIKTISGPPELVPAAVEAAKQWHFHPPLRDGKPVEVESTFTVNYHLTGGDLSTSAPEPPAH